MKKHLNIGLLVSISIFIAGCETPKPIPEPIIQKRVNVLESGGQKCLLQSIPDWQLDKLLSQGVKIRGERREFEYDANGPRESYYPCRGSIYILEGNKSIIDLIQYNTISN